MPTLNYYNPATLTWEELPTVGPQGPTGVMGPTGALGPTGPTGLGADEVTISDTVPGDTGIELWVNTATTTTASGWSIFDTRYAGREPLQAANVDLISSSGYWIVDSSTLGTLPPDQDRQVVHAVVLGPNMQAQYAYDLSCDGADGVTTVHHRHKFGDGWSPWVNVTPGIVG